MKYTPLLILLQLCLFSMAISANFQYAGNVTKTNIDKNVIQLQLENGTAEIQLITDEIVRVRFYPASSIPVESSYAVLPLKINVKITQINDTEKSLEISTPKILVKINKNPLRIGFYDQQGNLISKDHDSFGMGWNGTKVYCWKELHDDEPFYGLGEKTRGLNKRGNAFTMWNSDIPAYSTTQDPLYQSHPFFLSIHGGKSFAYFLDNSYRTFFNFGAGNNQFYYFGADDGVLDYYFIYGEAPKAVLENYGRLVGTMPLPPKWGLGYQQCRWSYYPATEVLALAKKFRDKQIPCDVIYLDIHYMDGYRVFTWHPQRFSEPKSTVSQLSEMGFKTAVIIDPGIKVDPDYWVYQQGISGDYFCRYPDGTLYQGQVWPGWCHFPDFSKPATRKWWGSLITKLTDVGVRGFWNDMNEPATWGGTFPDNVNFNFEGRGADHLRMHNLYGLLMAKSTYEGARKNRPNERPLVLTRAGFSGVQRYSAVWTGDNVASWEHLKLSAQMCLGLSISGVTFCGPDIGGFAGAPTPDLFTRWIQLGIFMPFFRTHTAINTPEQEPWSFGDYHEEINRKFIRLRYQLLPYLYNAIYQSYKKNTPVLRAMILEFPDDDRSYWMDDQFFFGDNFLVAPIFAENQTARKVYFPEGSYFDFWTDEKIEGKSEKLVDAPLNKIPIFVKGGSVLPMQDWMNYVGEKKIESLQLHVYPIPGKFRSTFYEDDGISYNYEKGQFSLTEFELNCSKKKVLFSIVPKVKNFEPEYENYLVVVHNVGNTIKTIQINGKKYMAVKSREELEERKGNYFYFNEDKKIAELYLPAASRASLEILF